MIRAMFRVVSSERDLSCHNWSPWTSCSNHTWSPQTTCSTATCPPGLATYTATAGPPLDSIRRRSLRTHNRARHKVLHCAVADLASFMTFHCGLTSMVTCTCYTRSRYTNRAVSQYSNRTVRHLTFAVALVHIAC